MGTRTPILRRLSAALSSAFLEWVLMLLLFVDAVYCFLVTRFARLCKLPVPCPFCSRLDHVLGNEKPCFYRDLICKDHKWEISSLAFCCLHQKLTGAHSMCEGCRNSIAQKEKLDTDGNKDEHVMNVSSAAAISSANLLDDDQGNNVTSRFPLTRICSCCGQHFKWQSMTSFSGKIAGLEPAEADISSRSCTDMSSQVSKSLEPKDIYHLRDHTSHGKYSELKMTFDSELEVPCTGNGNSNSPLQLAYNIEKHLHEDMAVEKVVVPSPEVVEPSELNVEKEHHVNESHNVSSLASPATDDNLQNEVGGSQLEPKDSSSERQVPQDDLAVTQEPDLKDKGTNAHVPQIPVLSNNESSQVLGAVEACQMRSESTDDAYISELAEQEPQLSVLGDESIKDSLQETHGSEITTSGELYKRSTVADDPSTTELIPQDTYHVVLEDADPKGEDEDYPKKSEATANLSTHEPMSQDHCGVASEDLVKEDNVQEAAISQAAISSIGEIPQALDDVEENPKTREIIGEWRPSLSTQISMNEAYKLAIGSKSSLPSPTLTDVILGKDSSSINGELRLLLSQLSAARGLDAHWLDPGPSPRAYGHGDNLVVQNITKRISLERNASGLESLDGSIVSELEGESTIDRLRRQIDLDRKSISLLCKELEEERNASAVAATQALAMITKLQDEKAAMQMEALHYQRMMEEQVEYENGALEKTHELLAQGEQQIEELEAELERYKRQPVGGRPTEEATNQVAWEEENNTTSVFDKDGLEVPVSSGKNPLLDFEEERIYITNCLRKLEQKLKFYSNNSTSIDLSNSDAKEEELPNEMPLVEDDSSKNHHKLVSPGSVGNDLFPPQEISNAAPEALLSGRGVSSAMSGEVDLSTIQSEISNLNRRLKILEGDRNFLEHSINSLRNGNDGLKFIQEIACNLRELRAIGIHRK